jgi:hypothetical protein
MSFADFAASIVSPDLRRVAMHWNEARGTNALPAWRDIRPAAIAPQLPLVWAYAYDAGADDFVGRLAGDVVARLFGRSFKGIRMTQLQPRVDVSFLFSRSKQVIAKPALFRSDGDIFHMPDRHGYGERIIMPLSDNGGAADGIFGATQYQTSYRPQDGNVAEHWFAIPPG